MNIFEKVAKGLTPEARRTLLNTDPVLPQGTTLNVLTELADHAVIDRSGRITDFGYVVRQQVLTEALDF